MVAPLPCHETPAVVDRGRSAASLRHDHYRCVSLFLFALGQGPLRIGLLLSISIGVPTARASSTSSIDCVEWRTELCDVP